MSQLPKSLLIVAGLFIAVGIDAIFWQVQGLGKHEAVYRLDILYILVGIGLLRRRIGWRQWAETFLVLGIIISALGITGISIILMLPLVTNELSFKAALRITLYLPILGLAIWLQLWMYRVLQRPQIYELFER